MIFAEPIRITEARRRIFVKAVLGKFQRLRWVGFGLLLALFLVTPWLRWGSRQAVLFDVPARRFHVFGLTIWPHEAYFLTLVIFTAAFGLFFFTALAGRMWCGYACPQTVFVSLFLQIERFFEGDRGKQLKLDQAGWTARKVATKVGKHAGYLLVSVIVGLTTVSYFVPREEVLSQFTGGVFHPHMTFWLALVVGSLYLDGAFFREQVCIYPCPYGRFQGALQDDDSLVVGYDVKRGEPRRLTRAAKARAASAAAAAGPISVEGGVAVLAALATEAPAFDLPIAAEGDCVDCDLCVQVCPQGIDIRDGLQGECITCASCIDACDSVMLKIGKPTGLVRYGSVADFGGRPRRILRPRIYLYAALLAIVTGALVVTAANRPEVDLGVNRAVGLYNLLPDGAVANAYKLSLLNLTEHPRKLSVGIERLAGAFARGQLEATVAGGQLLPLSLAVVEPKGATHGSVRFQFVLRDGGRVVARHDAAFLAP